MNLNLNVRKVSSNENGETLGRGPSRTPWSTNESSAPSLGVCYRGQEQSNSPGGSQAIVLGSSRSQRLIAKLPVRRDI